MASRFTCSLFSSGGKVETPENAGAGSPSILDRKFSSVLFWFMG
jgi:hypothetical protein